MNKSQPKSEIVNKMVMSDSNTNDNTGDKKERMLNADVEMKMAKEGKKVPQELINLLSGGISGMVAKSFVAPIDRIKILYQVTNAKFQLRNVPGVAHSIVSQEGTSGLWKGNTATMLRVFPYAGIQFMTYDSAKRYILNSKNPTNYDDEIEASMTPFENLLAGMCAGTVSVLCTYPLDLTRAQLAVLVKDKSELRSSQSISSVFMSNFNKGGIKGLFRGIGPTLIGIMPYSGLAFTINEQSKTRIRIRTKREPTNIEKLQGGAIAGAFAQSITYPLEVTRRRMQTHGLISESISDNLLKQGTKGNNVEQLLTQSTQISMRSTMKYLYKEQGVAGFFKGLSMNWIKGPIAFSISFTSYDIIKGYFNRNESFHVSEFASKITS